MSALADAKGLYLGIAPDTFLSGWAQTARQIIDSDRLGGITGTMSINCDSVFFDKTYFAIYGNKGILCPG